MTLDDDISDSILLVPGGDRGLLRLLACFAPMAGDLGPKRNVDEFPVILFCATNWSCSSPGTQKRHASRKKHRAPDHFVWRIKVVTIGMD